MDFDKDISCYTCKHGYFKEVEGAEMEHNNCGADKCYLCALRNQYCDKYEKGDVPEGKSHDSLYLFPPVRKMGG